MFIYTFVYKYIHTHYILHYVCLYTIRASYKTTYTCRKKKKKLKFKKCGKFKILYLLGCSIVRERARENPKAKCPKRYICIIKNVYTYTDMS